MLKIDLHIHSKEDLDDNINYSAKQLINKAKILNFNAISFTFHNNLFFNKELIKYAKLKNILLIPGVEIEIENKHVLIYNISIKEFKNLKKSCSSFEKFSITLNEIKKKNKDVFVVAPHPYFILPYCVGNLLEKHNNIFDAVEFSWFFTKIFNLNKKGIKIAKKYNLPIIANSDCHLLDRFGKNYSLIDCQNCNVKSIFKAIKQNKIKIVSNPERTTTLIKDALEMLLRETFKKKHKF
jgi:predicted metal-dependent phosphoesterase TrpH